MADLDQTAMRWLRDAQNGSPEALGRLLDHYRRYLLLIAERELDPALKAKGGASDLVQETFLEAQRDFPRLFAGTTDDELRAWLRRLLLNNLNNFSRSYRGTAKRAIGREVNLEPAEWGPVSIDALTADEPSPSRHAMALEQVEAIKNALAKLPDDYQRVIVLRYEEEKTFEEVGRIMGRSSEAVRKLWVRAMQMLRSEWEAEP